MLNTRLLHIFQSLVLNTSLLLFKGYVSYSLLTIKYLNIDHLFSSLKLFIKIKL
jgi:hypothetical protein